MEVPIMDGKEACGRLTADTLGLYTRFRADLDRETLCRLCAVFEGGTISLGVPVPEHGGLALRANIPTARLPRGKLLRCELRPTRRGDWTDTPGGTRGGVTMPPGQARGRTHRFSWRPGQRLPCDEWLCFYRMVQEQDGAWLEIELDEDGRPAIAPKPEDAPDAPGGKDSV